MMQRGFSLLELMIAVAILGILSGIAIPLYRGYINSSQLGVLAYNISTIEVFQEDFRLRNGAYLTVAADLPTIEAAIGWAPQEVNGVAYSIAAGPAGSYEVTAVSGPDTVCIRFPEADPC